MIVTQEQYEALKAADLEEFARLMRLYGANGPVDVFLRD